MKRIRLIIPLLLLSFSLLGLACGRKGPPRLIKNEFNGSIEELRGELRGDEVHLNGRIKGLNRSSNTNNPVKGCRVYYGQYPFDNAPCEGCPIQYSGYHEFGPQVIKGEEFLCTMSGLSRSQIYFFKVHLVGGEGAIGPPSNTIRVKVDE